MVPGAHATDGLGSIRIPASACGLVGLKPTHGYVPSADHWNGLSHTGFVTRSVDDTAVLLDAVSGTDESLARSPKPPASLRIARTTKAASPAKPVADVSAALDRATELLRRLGHTVIDLDPPYGAALAASNSVRYLAGVHEDVSALADPSATESRTRALARLGSLLPRRAVDWARQQGTEFGAAMTSFFTDVDLLLMPTMPVLPRKAGCLAERGTLRTLLLMLPCAGYTGPWNACGLPAVSLPVGTASSGLPVGIQLVGPRHSEALLLAVAAGLEVEAGWLDRRADDVTPTASIP
jgi:amidase